jgi:hypothetical protein
MSWIPTSALDTISSNDDIALDRCPVLKIGNNASPFTVLHDLILRIPLSPVDVQTSQEPPSQIRPVRSDEIPTRTTPLATASSSSSAHSMNLFGIRVEEPSVIGLPGSVAHTDIFERWGGGGNDLPQFGDHPLGVLKGSEGFGVSHYLQRSAKEMRELTSGALSPIPGYGLARFRRVRRSQSLHLCVVGSAPG